VFLPLVIVAQCISKDLRKTFHQLGVGFAKAVKWEVSSFFGARGYCLRKFFRVSTALDFFIVAQPPLQVQLPTARGEETPANGWGNFWQATRRRSDQRQRDALCSPPAPEKAPHCSSHWTTGSGRRETRTDSIVPFHGKLPAAVGRDW